MWNRFRDKMAQFMRGRYGVDKFSQFLSVLVMILIILNIFARSGLIWWLVILLIIYIYYRMFSKNIAKRYREDQKYQEITGKIRSFFGNFSWNMKHLKENREKNKGYHIYKCPRCGQKIRIPKGKGHIMVRCPKCGFEFHKKS